ncbi:MAG: YiiX/YebB-like N1pC/P60 family cysteine hydrolase [Lentisphaeria bacterium]
MPHRLPPLLLVLLFPLLAASCRQVPLLTASEAGLPPRAEEVQADLATARALTLRSLDWRARGERFRREVSRRLATGVLTSADLAHLYHGGEDYVLLDRRWQALIDCQGDEAWRRATPKLAADPLMRLQTKLVLAAALMQYDNYAIGVQPFFSQPKLRRLLKNDHPEVDGELDAAARRFLNPITRQRLAGAVVWYRAEGGTMPAASPDEAFLNDLIGNSAGYRFFSRALPERLVKEWETGGHAAVTFVGDLLLQFGNGTVHVTSATLGNTMGLVETRKGYLRDLSAADRTALQTRLRPLDVLLEKTPFRLTDKSIPGHYGHVAVWVGGERDLRDLGLWDEPAVRPYHQRLQTGAGIVEALRPGVELNTLDHFLNIDDLLVIRPRPLGRETARAALLRAFEQLGKAYDFNFDVESDRRIVCSELAFVVFPDVAWPTSKLLGRASISPDQVAVRALPGGAFEPMILYHDGVEIRDRLPETLQCLLAENRAALRALHPEFTGRSDRPARP